MKRCPVCDRTFDDSMKFCQVDGTPLVAAGGNETFDPMKTSVSNLSDESEQPFDSYKTMVGNPVSVEENTSDDSSARTQILSPEEMDREMNANSVKDETIKDDSLPSPLDSQTHSWMDSPDKIADEYPSPSSSPFNESRSSGYNSPAAPFQEPEPMFGKQPDSFNQIAYGNQDQSYNQPFQPTEWTPPPAPISEWQNQNINSNTPFQSPVASSQNPNQTLPIISLVCGVLSFLLFCCYGGVPLGIAALITGYLGIQNINKDSLNYTGRTLAIVGMIFGGISVALSIIGLIFIGIGGIFR